MIITKKQKIETDTVKDVVCDSCGCSTKISEEFGDFEYGTLKAFWGYCSSKDGTEEEYHICEKCFDNIIENFSKNTKASL